MPRFRCRACRRTCSLQSFAFSYYLKRADLSPPIAAGLVAGSAHRQIARSLRCAPSTVTRRAARLGRHSLLLLQLALEHRPALGEPLNYDDFETFAGSQDQPLGIGTAVGHHSWFVYALEPAPHRRRGRITPAQRQRLACLRLPRYGDSANRALKRVLERFRAADAPLHLITDDLHAYRRAIDRVPLPVRHEIHPNPHRGPKGSPRSLAARRRDRALFPVDLLHALLRHSAKHHARETLAFGRRHNALMERAFLFAGWRNFVKRRSERRADSPTPAMVLGLTRQPWDWNRLLARRLFVDAASLSPSWETLYFRRWITPHTGPNRTHDLVYAV